MEGELFPCDVVTIATNLSSTELVFVEFIPLSPKWHTMIRFDNQHQFTSQGNEIFGGTELLASNLLPEDSSLLVLKERVMLSKSQPSRICTDSGQAKMFQCTQDYLVRNMPCHLPWLPKNEDSQKRPCNETHDWIVWKEVWEHLYKDVTYEKIVKTTGCVPNCFYRKYEANMASVSIPPVIDPLVNGSHLLVLQMPQGIVTFQTEKYFYDASSFVADVGGFLGLLLGLSVMDIVEMVISVFKWITEITFKTKIDPVS
ncbi:uncharacterized protein LOC131890449 [Tigriopus californicus]|uniref:uncharacterized protein LOC131890449 n=1 Tax=Tigriopus californicus TaxID=6832 RepID=UPI0027D9FA41|nr:uncharacterized protein LOC131890449 [Tigriopus californicus]